MRVFRILGAALVAAVLVGGTVLMRDATLTRHDEVDPDTTVEVVVRARTKGGEVSQTIGELTEALLLACRLEVSTDPVGNLVDLGDDRYSMLFQPALDRADRRQFRGCIEDWRLDHVLVDVEELREGPAK